MRLVGVLIVVALLLAGCGAPRAPAQAAQDDLQSGSPTNAPAAPAIRVSIVTDPLWPHAGQVVLFQAKAQGLPSGDRLASAAWTFGDGDGATELSPVHTYAANATFKVGVQLVTKQGHKAEGRLDLQVGGASGFAPGGSPGLSALSPPVLDVQLSGSVGRFAFTAPYEPVEVVWRFGDGATSAEASPQHAYLSTGEFLVELTLTVGGQEGYASTPVRVLTVSAQPRVVVGVSDSGINPYHAVYYRPEATAHPCTYIVGYTDCSIRALPLSVGPANGTYAERLEKDRALWDSVQTNTWYWIPRTAIIAAHCPTPYVGDATDTSTYAAPVCILDDTQTHGTQTTSSVLSEVPEAWLVFNEGSGAQFLADAPVAVDVESNSWGSLAPLYGGYAHAAGVDVCNDDADTPTGIKLRSAGNNGPVPNMGDCWRNGYRSYSVSGGYPSGQHGQLSGSTPDFASYWCRPAADPHHVSEFLDSICGTSFAAPTAAGTVAAALLQVRRELGYVGGSTTTEVAPGVTHEAFLEAMAWGATYAPTPRAGFPSSSTVAYPTGTTPWAFWGWGWLHAEQAPAIASCALGKACPDNKSPEAWAFNEARRGFAAG